MKSSHSVGAVSVRFDEPNLVGVAGLVPFVRLAERCGLPRLIDGTLRLEAVGSAGANPAAKVLSVVAGMCAGADSIADTDLLRHGGMGLLFGGVRAPSTVGTFLRSFTHGHNRQLHKVHRGFLAELAAMADVLPGKAEMALVDIDPSHVRVYGRKKQGAEYGRLKGERTLHPILSTISTAGAAPVIGPVRLRRGTAADVRGARSFTVEAIAVARQAGCTGNILVRADSKFYTADVVAACQRGGVWFSLTTGMNAGIAAAIGRIGEDAWIDIAYPNPIEDPDTGQLISKAQVAEIGYTAFTGRRQREQVTARLIVRRVVRENPDAVHGQDELFCAYRYHPVFTDNPAPLVEAEAAHRGHAIIELQISDAKASALAHFPSGSFQANAAWLTLAAMSHNLTRAAGVLAGPQLARAETATIRTRLSVQDRIDQPVPTCGRYKIDE
jgi:hypothetical protein